ncbi:hypothetical protein [Nonomuraea sp. NPDC049709]|uniref:hypothetical protein n=1 Tax=Nonomuraea sp. NPDC049709 TaxID=3154736 RepID=UPI0034424EB8
MLSADGPPCRELVSPGEFAVLPWPARPRCGEDISVDHAYEVIDGKEPVIVGAGVLTEIPAQVVAKPTLCRCTGATCTAGGAA